MQTIPSTRAVTARDLEHVKQQYAIGAADACWLFGVSITKWTQMRKNPDEPIKDVALSLLVRFLAEHPELSPIPNMPSAHEMFEKFNKLMPVDQKAFAVMLGAEASAGYRWLKQNSRQGPALQRLMHYLNLALMVRSHSDQVQLLSDWKATVEKEWAARDKPTAKVLKLNPTSAPSAAIKRTKTLAAPVKKTALRKNKAAASA